MFSEAEESTPQETVSQDDSQEERERKERIPQRKADISRCWSKYCLDLLKSSRDKCIQELRNSDQGDEDRNTEQGLKIFFGSDFVTVKSVLKPYQWFTGSGQNFYTTK